MKVKRYQKAGKTGIAKKAIPLDTQVIIVNNTAGIFVYSHEKFEHMLQLKEPTAYEALTLKDLKIMSQHSKGIFTDYSILIADVLDEEYTLKDVYAYLDLMSVYDELMFIAKNEDGIDTGMFERFAVNSPVKVFKDKVLRMTRPCQHRLIQAVFHAYKSGVISDKQQGYDKVVFVGYRILKMEEDIIDVLKFDTRPPAFNVREVL